ncbi:hypothetical protein [Thermoactinomyces sp. CICC 23799]|jgi:hypothetical protein|uniref:hypothetical protein n=1 Tax=Thermoactinomyces sp. CICC 23799 TaxID=2767429 RepID=UPI0018DE5937|nr:hypothetical protein [Thermoactinomyces sp. CICC 23799]MBH8601387.1 hypothetical protein [Thermoactinomyces sp. CICC 23799]
MITGRKIKITIVSDNREEAYDFIRDEMRKQNWAMNMAMNHLFFNFIARQKMKLADSAYLEKEQKQLARIEKTKEAIQKARTDEKKAELKETLKKQQKKLEDMQKKKNLELFEQFTQIIGGSEQTSIRDVISSQFHLTSDTKDCLCMKVYQDFKNDVKNGLLKGERSLRTYKKDNPLYIRGRSLKLYKEDGDFYFKWIKGIVFLCILRSKGQNKTELYKTLDRILEGKIDICDSSVEFDRKNRLILNLSLEMPAAVLESKIAGRVVGVDLGLKIPAYVALNDDHFPRKAIGSIDDFLKVRTSLRKSYPGHPRKDLLLTGQPRQPSCLLQNTWHWNWGPKISGPT